MVNDLEIKDLIDKLDKLEKENIKINNKLKNLQKENTQIINSYDVLFNNLFIYHDLKPKELLTNSREIILQMLDFIDNICKKYDLEWFLTAGSALGALRHGGFIPWDDDCDIGMMRPDYEKFVKIIKKEVKNYGMDKYIRVNTAPKVNKLRLPFTKFDYLGENKLLGFIDVFPFDYILNPDENTKKIYMEEHKRLRNELNNGKKREEILKESFSKLNITLDKTNYVMPSLEVSSFAYAIYNYDDFFPLKKIKFENRYYPVPYNVEIYSKLLYGDDYMKLPKAVRIHDFHHRLLKTENILNILEKHIIILKEANENIKKSIEFKNTKMDMIKTGKGQAVEKINELNIKSLDSFKITKIDNSSTWTDFVIKNISVKDLINAKFNLINPNSELSVFFVYFDYEGNETFSNSLKITDKSEESRQFSVSTPIGENIRELHLRFWIVNEINSYAYLNNISIEKTIKLTF